MKLVHATLLCAAIGASLPAFAAVSDANWTESLVANNSGSSGHTGLAWAPDDSDRLFVIEKGGRVRILSGLTTTGTGTWSTFATITPIETNSECGLIGMAFDPDFANNHFVYFFVTVSSSEQQIIRYDASTNTGTGKTTVVPNLPTAGQNHDGGGVGFAGDGKLYWSVGDRGNRTGVDNDLTSLAAKVGRANRDGTLPPGNPFADGAGPNNDFIYARGMRNPFTMQIQPSTGLIWLNVVGDGYEQIFVVRSGDHGGYDNFENNQPAPTATEQYITPAIVYPTSSSGVNLTINNVSRTGGIATITTNNNHRLRVGSNVSIAGTTNATFHGANQFVASVPSNTTFTVLQVGADANGTGGTATTLPQGRAVSGGVFYDATAASAEYRGNFFYGDYVDDRIMRARIDEATNRVIGVTHWGTGIPGQIDLAVGPDGALYYTGVGTGDIFRAAFNATGQALIVANRNLRIDENGDAMTSVRLAQAPGANVQVNVARSSGDADVTVDGGATLTFTPSNWNRPQFVSLAAAVDFDGTDDAATVSVSSAGLTTEDVRVTVLDLGDGFADGFED